MMKKTLLIYFVIALFFLIGFYTHTSYQPDILVYSKTYFIFLMAMTIGLLVIVPFLLHWFLKKNTPRDLAFAALPSVVLLMLIYAGANLYYYSDRQHLFDPFMQVPPSTYYYETPKDTSVTRILCLGGSTTRFVNADSLDRYPSILQQVLDDQYPNKYEVLNAGMDWYTSKHSLINYAAYCRNFKADKVIVMHAINDLYRSFSPPDFSIGDYESDYSHFYGPSINGAKPKSFSGLIYQNFRKIWFGKNVKPRDFELSEFVSITDFEDYLSQLIELVSQDGAQIYLVSQGHMYADNLTKEELNTIWMSRTFCEKNNTFPNIKSLRMAMDAYNETTQKVARANQVPYIDADKMLPKNGEHFIDDVHYTTLGSKKLAEMIGKEIVK